MKNYLSNSNFLAGVLILGATTVTLYIKSFPIIWIGGFIWGIQMLTRGFNEASRHKHLPKKDGIEKEIIRCKNCSQLLRVPKDRTKYSIITCVECKSNPFVYDLNHKIDILRKIKHLFRKRQSYYILFSILAVMGFTYYVYSNNKTDEPKTNTTSSENLAPPPKLPKISLPNGTVIDQVSSYMQGPGKLQIENGTNYDAIAKLVINNKSIYTVYIKANSTYTIEGISDGIYKLYFNSGESWFALDKKFLKNFGYSTFDDTFNFRTTVTQEGEYEHAKTTGFKVTLNPVISGKATTSDINQDEFNNL